MMSQHEEEEDQLFKLICPYCGEPLKVADIQPVEIMNDGCGVRLFFLCPIDNRHFTLGIPIPLSFT